jgi:hypothetical protein
MYGLRWRVGVLGSGIEGAHGQGARRSAASSASNRSSTADVSAAGGGGEPYGVIATAEAVFTASILRRYALVNTRFHGHTSCLLCRVSIICIPLRTGRGRSTTPTA